MVFETQNWFNVKCTKPNNAKVIHFADICVWHFNSPLTNISANSYENEIGYKMKHRIQGSVNMIHYLYNFVSLYDVRNLVICNNYTGCWLSFCANVSDCIMCKDTYLELPTTTTNNSDNNLFYSKWQQYNQNTRQYYHLYAATILCIILNYICTVYDT